MFEVERFGAQSAGRKDERRTFNFQRPTSKSCGRQSCGRQRKCKEAAGPNKRPPPLHNLSPAVGAHAAPATPAVTYTDTMFDAGPAPRWLAHRAQTQTLDPEGTEAANAT